VDEEDILGQFDIQGLAAATSPEERAAEKPLLKPYLEKLCATLLQVMQFPTSLGGNFELDRFVNLRELCATITTEALVVVEPQWMLTCLGDELARRAPAGQALNWPEVECCMHMLTAVAPRAEAGKDQVIPQMVYMIPSLPYPANGEEMLLMRCAAARFIMYTVGYLSQNEEKTFPVVLFLAKELLPSLYMQPACDLRQYCEALLCETLKLSIGAMRTYLVREDAAARFHDLTSALMSSIAHTGFHPDNRAQLLFGLGNVIACYKDMDRVKNTYGQMVGAVGKQAMEAMAKPIPPADMTQELRLYTSALSAVPLRVETVPQFTEHPILAVVEQNWQLIEQIWAKSAACDELATRLGQCFMGIASVSRAHFPTSQLFPALLDLSGKSFQSSPQWGYVALVRGLLGLFGHPGAAHGARDPKVQQAMFAKVVVVAGIFAQHVLALLRDLQDLDRLHSVGQFFELCSDALRMPIPGLVAAAWFNPMVETCVRLLDMVDFQTLMLSQLSVGSIGSLCRFLEATALEGTNGGSGLQVLKQTVGIQRIVFALMKMTVNGAAQNAQMLLPCVAQTLEPLFKAEETSQESYAAVVQVLATLPLADADRMSLQQQLLTSSGRALCQAILVLGQKCAPEVQRSLRA
jgi:hypothetical protein